ncbi:YgiQ family radical SAM protein [Ferrimonas balearica]|uniref:YgiQ family radical SAM protein n=1 Tax=Ferrimonas balearica TaxID=44012 RepID=UPI001F24FD2F|nr:YgiQ family radical SAM protein [Ferrimonas balearica]MBY6096468.1 YgiQ family radical SAM protein [Ferrimonas balearica]
MIPTPKTKLFDYPKFWAECLGPAPFLPTTRAEMDLLGWDSCDIIMVTGDAYVDHPSFGMAVIGRMLESQGFRVGIIDQPDWQSKAPFMALGKPNLFFGVTAGNMDSMINHYTADRRLRHDDAYTPDNVHGKRPDRATVVYTQRCKEAYKDVPVILGGIEASLRRIAHYDYWSDKVRRSVLFDAKADMLIFGNAERPLVEVAHRLSQGDDIKSMRDIRGTAFLVREALPGWNGVDSRTLDTPGKIDPIPNPYGADDMGCELGSKFEDAPVQQQAQPITLQPAGAGRKLKPWEQQYILLPDYEQVRADKVLYAHTSRLFHLETNPGCARALMQRHGDRYVWINPPAIPLETDEMDGVFALPYARVPHPKYDGKKIPAYDMIKTSINIMRGCFGGCSFCSITEHEGRIIQSRSQESILDEIEQIKEKVPGFTGVISDLGGPTANMYKLRCKSPKAEATCRRLSCIYPDICGHMDTDHTPTIELYRAAREIPGIKRIFVASGVRYDLAVEDPRYVKELVQHHVGGYLKIAPEHTEEGPLSIMMKPGMGSYYRFKEMFDRFSKEAGKEQYLIPYFISAHPGASDEDMVNLAMWLKRNKFRLDQVQNFYPSPLANATTVWHTGKNSLRKVTHDSEDVPVAKGGRQRRLHKALLRYHDTDNWPIIREGLLNIGLGHLIGSGPDCLVPAEGRRPAHRGGRTQPALTKHSGQGQFQSRSLPGKSKPAAKGKGSGNGKGNNASGQVKPAGKGQGSGRGGKPQQGQANGRGGKPQQGQQAGRGGKPQSGQRKGPKRK